jgi:hypothetical protein
VVVRDYKFEDYQDGGLVSSVVIKEPDQSILVIGDRGHVSCEWDFGDGNTASGEVVSHTYDSYRWDSVNGTYLPYTLTLTVCDNNRAINTTVYEITIYMLGDANGDGRVNILDISLMGLHWNARGGEADYDDRADLNNDNWVNITDAAIVGLHWNERAS